MNIIDIILKKKNKEILTEEEIKYVVENFDNGNIKDYQMSALLMAIVINDMTDEEVIYLTKYMIQSGSRIDLSNLNYQNGDTLNVDLSYQANEFTFAIIISLISIAYIFLYDYKYYEKIKAKLEKNNKKENKSSENIEQNKIEEKEITDNN